MTKEEKDLKYRKVRFDTRHSLRKIGMQDRPKSINYNSNLDGEGWLLGFSTENLSGDENHVVAIIEVNNGECITRTMGSFILVD